MSVWGSYRVLTQAETFSRVQQQNVQSFSPRAAKTFVCFIKLSRGRPSHTHTHTLVCAPDHSPRVCWNKQTICPCQRGPPTVVLVSVRSIRLLPRTARRLLCRSPQQQQKQKQKQKRDQERGHVCGWQAARRKGRRQRRTTMCTIMQIFRGQHRLPLLLSAALHCLPN
jgi:hypothetical protein